MTPCQTEKAIAMFTGVTALSGRIAAQVAIIGPRSFLQPLMCGVGITIIVLGVKLRREHEAGS